MPCSCANRLANRESFMDIYFDQPGEAATGYYFNARSFLLLGGFVLLAVLAGCRGILPRGERDGLLAICPPLVFICWILFQPGHFSFPPFQVYQAGADERLAWRTNDWLCLGFGVLYSSAVVCREGFWRRTGGGIFLALFLALIFSVKFRLWAWYHLAMFFPHGH